jgi:gluconolactonase
VRIVAIARLDVATGDVTTVVEDANAANGMTLDRDRRLVVCEQGGPRRDAAITLVDPRTGEREVLVDRVAGRPLNSPNDVAVGPDGAVWFTDPAYGWLQGFRPRPRLGDHVYRHDRTTGATVLVARGFDKPNGIALCPDGRRVGVIPLPGAVNFAWGGPGRNVLFITTDTAVYAAVLTTQGA